MPIAIGGVSSHDDSMHSGSAKRGAANGVAGLDAAGKIDAAAIPDLSATYAPLSDGVSANRKTGNYVGNSTANRAIPHNLGHTPTVVFITNSNYFGIMAAAIFNGYIISVGNRGVTAADATNFYVGTAGAFPDSANNNAETYKWVAIG